MNNTFSIRADWIWTGDERPLPNACLTIRNERVVSIDCSSPPTAIDIGSYCILPGLINSHTHLEFNDLPSPIEAGPTFADWIQRVILHRKNSPIVDSSDPPSEPWIDGLKESRTHGVRLVLDVVHPKPSESVSLGLRQIQRLPFAELIGTTSQRAKQTWRAALEMRRTSGRSLGNLDPIAIEDDTPRQGRCPVYPMGLSPHAPYTTTEKLVQRAVTKCRRWSIPIMMHLAESLDELRWLDSGDGPLQELLEATLPSEPIFEKKRSHINNHRLLSTRNRWPLAEYVHELCQAPSTFIVHGNFLDEPSMNILALHRQTAAVVYCPRTHAHFRHPIHPLLELRQRGIPVILGTDSRASNPNLSILEEARHVRRAFPTLTASDIFRMITSQPAELLGCSDVLGSIRFRSLYRLTAIRCHATRTDDVLEELLENSEPAQPLECIVDPSRANRSSFPV